MIERYINDQIKIIKLKQTTPVKGLGGRSISLAPDFLNME